MTTTPTVEPVRQPHPFERAGFGVAPFRYVGHTEITFQACPGAPVKPGGSCDYCSTAIRNAFWILSADGRRFKVGSECVHKTCKEGGPIRKAVDHELAKRAKAQRTASAAVRIAAATAALAADPALLTGSPHPVEWHAKAGLTARDHAEWLLAYAGEFGKLDAARKVEKALKAA